MNKICKKCGRELAETAFYKTNNFIRYPDKRLDICKNCINEELDSKDLNTYLTVLEECKVPFLEHQWNILKEKYSSKYILNKYLSMIDSGSFKNLEQQDEEYEKIQSNYIPKEVQHSIRELINNQKDKAFPHSDPTVGNFILLSSSNRIIGFENSYPWFTKYKQSRTESKYINSKTEEKWQTMVASKNGVRGRRFYKVIADSTINFDLFQIDILPCIYSYCTFIDFFD